MPPRKFKQSSTIPASEDTAEPEEVAEAAAPVVTARRARNEIVIEPRMKFSVWFMVKAQDDSRLKPHHQETLRAFMTGHGLSAEEPTRRYDAALATYFGT